ncbi:MAG: hypothetical protein IPN71_03160 [Fibrobacteres bacterium]|nr:hypothetical protein [Fibrobacterota bacterium]
MKPLDLALFRKSIALGLFGASLVFASTPEPSRLPWILSRIDSVPLAGSGSISHCAGMEVVQRTLLSRRDSITSLRTSGRSRLDSCKTLARGQDSICSNSLQSLRDSLKSLAKRESVSGEELRQESSQCPAGAWATWLRYRSLDSTLAATPVLDSGADRNQTMEELAELGWTGNLDALLNGTDPARFRLDPLVQEWFTRPSASCRWRLRQAFFLEWTGRGDSAHRILESILAPELCAHEAALANHWLGTDPRLAGSLRMPHLRKALPRSDVRPRSLVELGTLLAAQERWEAAFDTLALGLRADPLLVSAEAIDSLAGWADRAGIDPDSRLADSGPPWLDQLLIARCRFLLATGRSRLAQGLLADFRLRFPRSSHSDEARELLARCRR